MTMKNDKSLPKNQCVGCGNYPMLLQWYKNEEMNCPQCCRYCAKRLIAIEM